MNQFFLDWGIGLVVYGADWYQELLQLEVVLSTIDLSSVKALLFRGRIIESMSIHKYMY